ncbi:MAG TPA: MBL fold metallo-hydrolase [Bacillota bacterium]|nr:MBL fold metallo-hydrolase [Bacillota bacterium]
MKIKWLGHSCFLITASSGVRILTDPFDESVGYRLPSVEADIVTTSHDHFDHNHVKVVKGDFKHIDSPGEYSERGVGIRGVASYHDANEGSERGNNVIFTFKVDGLKVCHAGDLGHLLKDEQVKAVGNVDILLLPVGGTYTLDYKEAAQVTSQLGPKTVIPMHYKTPAIDFTIDGVDKYLEAMDEDKDSYGAQEVEFTADSLEKLGRVLVLDYE